MARKPDILGWVDRFLGAPYSPERRVLVGELGLLAVYGMARAGVDAGRLFSAEEATMHEPMVEADREPTSSELERLEQLGLEFTVPFYTEVRRLVADWEIDISEPNGHFPQIWMYQELRAIATDATVAADDSRVVRWRDGWGARQETLYEDAMERMAGASFHLGQHNHNPDDLTEYPGLLKRVVETFPLLGMVMPLNFAIEPGGGLAGGDVLTVSRADEASENDEITAGHEGLHIVDSEGSLELLKPYVDRDAWMKQEELAARLIDTLVQHWVSRSTTREAVDFKGLALYLGEKKDRGRVLAWVATLEKLFLDMSEPEYVEPVDGGNFLWRFADVTHTVAHVWWKHKHGKDLTNREQDILGKVRGNLPRFRQLMGYVLWDFRHHLVGPPQDNDDGGFPHRRGDLEEGLLETCNELYWRVRLLQLAPKLGADASFMQIRKDLGLEGVEGEPAEVGEYARKRDILLRSFDFVPVEAFVASSQEQFPGLRGRVYDVPDNPFMPERANGLVDLNMVQPNPWVRGASVYGLAFSYPKGWRGEGGIKIGSNTAGVEMLSQWVGGKPVYEITSLYFGGDRWITVGATDDGGWVAGSVGHQEEVIWKRVEYPVENFRDEFIDGSGVSHGPSWAGDIQSEANEWRGVMAKQFGGPCFYAVDPRSKRVAYYPLPFDFAKEARYPVLRFPDNGMSMAVIYDEARRKHWLIPEGTVQNRQHMIDPTNISRVSENMHVVDTGAGRYLVKLSSEGAKRVEELVAWHRGQGSSWFGDQWATNYLSQFYLEPAWFDRVGLRFFLRFWSWPRVGEGAQISEVIMTEWVVWEGGDIVGSLPKVDDQKQLPVKKREAK